MDAPSGRPKKRGRVSKRDVQPAWPLRLMYDGKYRYVGFWRHKAHCWLRVYAPVNHGDLPFVVLTDMPDNPGTSTTNFAEKLAWKIEHDPSVWAKAPKAPKEGCIWILHHPEERFPDVKQAFPERFTMVSFTYDQEAEADAMSAGTITLVAEDLDDPDELVVKHRAKIPAAGNQGTLGEPVWESVSRERVERMVGQPLAPIPEKTR
jgi:hypothetical protein